MTRTHLLECCRCFLARARVSLAHLVNEWGGVVLVEAFTLFLFPCATDDTQASVEASGVLASSCVVSFNFGGCDTTIFWTVPTAAVVPVSWLLMLAWNFAGARIVLFHVSLERGGRSTCHVNMRKDVRSVSSLQRYILVQEGKEGRVWRSDVLAMRDERSRRCGFGWPELPCPLKRSAGCTAGRGRRRLRGRGYLPPVSAARRACGCHVFLRLPGEHCCV